MLGGNSARELHHIGWKPRWLPDRILTFCLIVFSYSYLFKGVLNNDLANYLRKANNRLHIFRGHCRNKLCYNKYCEFRKCFVKVSFCYCRFLVNIITRKIVFIILLPLLFFRFEFCVLVTQNCPQTRERS